MAAADNRYGKVVARRGPRWLAGLVLFAMFPACGILDTEDRGPEEALVNITGDTPVPLQLITSDAYVITVDPETFDETVDLLNADTASLSDLPFSNIYSIATFDRFLIRLTNPDTLIASVRMTVTVDGSVEYDVPANISEGGTLEFRYQVNQLF